jgi:hypothetical protein
MKNTLPLIVGLVSLAVLLLAGLGASNEQCLAAGSTDSPSARTLPQIRVQKGGHYLETEDGHLFFWLGDTAWQLIDVTTPDECSYYLHARARQGFTVVQLMVLDNAVSGYSPPGLKPIGY